jgi:RNA polymerase sigma factor (sigma-70 family)
MSTIEFNKLLVEYRNPLKYFALSLTNDSDDAQDLLQDTMYKALLYREKFSESTNLKAWLYTIMKNTFINNYRRSKKTNEIMESTKEIMMSNIRSNKSFESPEALISQKDIKKEIDGLENDFKIPFQRFFDGYKYKEIADEMDLPIGTIKSRIFLARKKLSSQLKDFR